MVVIGMSILRNMNGLNMEQQRVMIILTAQFSSIIYMVLQTIVLVEQDLTFQRVGLTIIGLRLILIQ